MGNTFRKTKKPYFFYKASIIQADGKIQIVHEMFSVRKDSESLKELINDTLQLLLLL